MRISTNQVYGPFETSLQNIQNSVNTDQTKIISQKDILNLSDDTKRLVEAKSLTNVINSNTQYKTNIDSAVSELQSTSTQLDAMSSKLQDLRQLAIDATQAGNVGNLPTIATQVKGILGDLVNDANYDYNGKYIFAGTLTTPASIKPVGTATDKLPFEITNVASDPTNLSGMQVVFKGNNNDRSINKDANTSEVINTKASDMFGAGGTALFNNVVSLYNLLEYHSDGTKRQVDDTFNTQDSATLNQLQTNIGNSIDTLNNLNGVAGDKISRLQLMSTQNTSENTQLQEFLSQTQDTDVAATTLDLQRNNNALQYTLQIGSQLVQKTLLDFLK